MRRRRPACSQPSRPCYSLRSSCASPEKKPQLQQISNALSCQKKVYNLKLHSSQKLLKGVSHRLAGILLVVFPLSIEDGWQWFGGSRRHPPSLRRDSPQGGSPPGHITITAPPKLLPQSVTEEKLSLGAGNFVKSGNKFCSTTMSQFGRGGGRTQETRARASERLIQANR